MICIQSQCNRATLAAICLTDLILIGCTLIEPGCNDTSLNVFWPWQNRQLSR